MKSKYDFLKNAIRKNPHPLKPVLENYKIAGVIALFSFDKDLNLLFIQKADNEGYPWRNQIAFPGGHKDDQDNTTKEAALRELEEEIGIKKEKVEIIGSLGFFQTINNVNIEAFAGFFKDKEKINYDPNEISRVFKIPLKILFDIHMQKGFNLKYPDINELIYNYKDISIWGVTAKIVFHIIEILTPEVNHFVSFL